METAIKAVMDRVNLLVLRGIIGPSEANNEVLLASQEILYRHLADAGYNPYKRPSK